jgi:hypothetical protein
VVVALNRGRVGRPQSLNVARVCTLVGTHCSGVVHRLLEEIGKAVYARQRVGKLLPQHLLPALQRPSVHLLRRLVLALVL